MAVAGFAALGLAVVGVGAGADFTTATTSQQTITAGTLGVSVFSADVAGCRTAAAHCTSLTLPNVGPVGSTFETAPTIITMQNTGNIPATFANIQMSETHDAGSAASNAMTNETSVCIMSTDNSGGPWVESNVPLSAAVAVQPTVVENPVVLQPGETATYSVNFYAGRDSRCGTVYSVGSHTEAGWESYFTHPYQTPASLTNDAQGGSVTPTLTFSFTG
jgi:hypothetical protein